MPIGRLAACGPLSRLATNERHPNGQAFIPERPVASPCIKRHRLRRKIKTFPPHVRPKLKRSSAEEERGCLHPRQTLRERLAPDSERGRHPPPGLCLIDRAQ